MDNIIIAIIGSGALSALIAGIFNLIINRRGRLGAIESELKQTNEELKLIKKDGVRTQLLVLISDYPNEKQEILKLAEYYFVTLHGNWYATALFNDWLIKNEIASPAWFQGLKGD